MKKVLLIALLLAMFLWTNVSLAQKASANDQTPITATSLIGPASDLPAMENINSKAIVDFNSKFRNAENVKWHRSSKANVASFRDGEKLYTVVYLENGKFLHTLINYGEAQLDNSIRDLVKKNFRNYTISWVTEVHEGDMISYFVKIEDAKRIKELVVYKGEVAVLKQLTKAPQ